MIAVLLGLSALATLASLLVPGASDLLMLAGPCLLASLWLWWRARPVAPPTVQARHIIVDGSNVLHWNAGEPMLETVLAVISELHARGYTPGVMFDANVGYKIGVRYQDDRELARQLGLPDDRVLVMPKGSPADRTILLAARRLGAQVVTNDRYRDWAEEFPEVSEPGLLGWGGMKDGKVWLKGLTPPMPQGLEAAKGRA